MENAKIIEYLGEDEKGNNKFVIVLPKEPEYNWMPGEDIILVAHDYVRIVSDGWVDMQSDKNGEYPIKTRGACNHYKIRTSVTIGIRDMIDIVLPYLNKHKYLQEKHIADRINHEDDTYFKQYGLDKPRYKKGDKYPAYAYMASIIKYYEDGNLIVNIRRNGEKVWSKLTGEIYQQIKESLQLAKTKWDLLKK